MMPSKSDRMETFVEGGFRCSNVVFQDPSFDATYSEHITLRCFLSSVFFVIFLMPLASGPLANSIFDGLMPPFAPDR